MKDKQQVFLRLFKRVLFILLLCYLLGGVFLICFQRSLLYFPAEAVNRGLKAMVVDNKEIKLKIIVLNEAKEDAIVYFGGNAEAVDVSSGDFAHYFKNYAVYLVNYRGYGGSSGKPSEEALYEDALLVYDKLKLKHKNIAVIGRSLGSGVATYVASKREVKKLILVTPFDSMDEIAKAQFPIYPIELMLVDQYNSIGRVDAIKAQTLLLIAGKDTLVPNQNSYRLYNAFSPSKVDLLTFDGFGHNDIQLAQHYYSAMVEFLNRDEAE